MVLVTQLNPVDDKVGRGRDSVFVEMSERKDCEVAHCVGSPEKNGKKGKCILDSANNAFSPPQVKIGWGLSIASKTRANVGDEARIPAFGKSRDYPKGQAVVKTFQQENLCNPCRTYSSPR